MLPCYGHIRYHFRNHPYLNTFLFINCKLVTELCITKTLKNSELLDYDQITKIKIN